jgi:hypothetical protein
MFAEAVQQQQCMALAKLEPVQRQPDAVVM